MNILNSIIIKTQIALREMMEDKRGDIVQTSVIIGILAILSIAVLTMMRTPITNVFNKIKSGLEGAL